MNHDISPNKLIHTFRSLVIPTPISHSPPIVFRSGSTYVIVSNLFSNIFFQFLGIYGCFIKLITGPHNCLNWTEWKQKYIPNCVWTLRQQGHIELLVVSNSAEVCPRWRRWKIWRIYYHFR